MKIKITTIEDPWYSVGVNDHGQLSVSEAIKLHRKFDTLELDTSKDEFVNFVKNDSNDVGIVSGIYRGPDTSGICTRERDLEFCSQTVDCTFSDSSFPYRSEPGLMVIELAVPSGETLEQIDYAVTSGYYAFERNLRYVFQHKIFLDGIEQFQRCYYLVPVVDCTLIPPFINVLSDYSACRDIIKWFRVIEQYKNDSRRRRRPVSTTYKSTNLFRLGDAKVKNPRITQERNIQSFGSGFCDIGRYIYRRTLDDLFA